MERKLGVFVFDRVTEYHKRIAEEAQDAAGRQGLPIEVFDADNTAAKQAQDLVRFATDNAGKSLCVLVVPLSDSADEGAVEADSTYRVARRIVQKGVGWITLNHGREAVVRALRQEFPALPIAMVVIDNVEFGRLQARQLRVLLPEGGTVLCVRGNPYDSASRDRSRGLKEGIAGSGLTLKEVDGRWDPVLAETAVAKWLSSPMHQKTPLHAVASQNDTMGKAARSALQRVARELGRPELAGLPVLGGDGLAQLGRRWVDERELTATVVVPVPGRPAIELIARHWRDRTPLPEVTRLAPTSYPPVSELKPVAPRP
jgi:ABC-type sugar transport system substrate-binding protein